MLNCQRTTLIWTPILVTSITKDIFWGPTGPLVDPPMWTPWIMQKLHPSIIPWNGDVFFCPSVNIFSLQCNVIQFTPEKGTPLHNQDYSRHLLVLKVSAGVSLLHSDLTNHVSAQTSFQYTSSFLHHSTMYMHMYRFCRSTVCVQVLPLDRVQVLPLKCVQLLVSVAVVIVMSISGH